MRFMLVLLVVVGSIVLVMSDGNVCLIERPCYCQLTNSSYIDLKPIGKLKAKHVDLGTSFHIYLCSLFTEVTCKNVLGCREHLLSFESLGNSSKFLDEKTIEIYNGYKGSKAVISLKCTKEQKSTLDFIGLNSTANNVYNFTLSSSDVCVKNNPTTPTATTLATNTTKSTPTTTTTKTTPTTTTTKTTPTTTTTKTTPTTNTTKTTPTTNTTKTTPVTNTTRTTLPTNSTTTVSTKPTSTIKTSPTTVTTAPKTSSTTTKPHTTTGKGGASTIYSYTLTTILLLSFITNKLLR